MKKVKQKREGFPLKAHLLASLAVLLFTMIVSALISLLLCSINSVSYLTNFKYSMPIVFIISAIIQVYGYSILQKKYVVIGRRWGITAFEAYQFNLKRKIKADDALWMSKEEYLKINIDEHEKALETLKNDLTVK